MDVMVFTPVLRLEPATVLGLMELEWEGPLTLVLQRDNPVTGDEARAVGIRNHLHQYQRGRELFLRGRYDALLAIESDIIPPRDTLKRLAAVGADVAYGCYMFQGGQVVNVLHRYYSSPAYRNKRARNIGEPLNVRGLFGAAVRAGVIECSGSGLGCALIQRRVVEAVPFEAPRGPTHFDYEWTQAVYSAGFRMMADMAVECGHVQPDGAILWPSAVVA